MEKRMTINNQIKTNDIKNSVNDNYKENNNHQQNIPSVLQKIIITKQQEVTQAKEKCPLNELMAKIETQKIPRRGFAKALRHAQQHSKQGIGIIAEIKKASPSKGIISHNFDPKSFAKQYQNAGATCLSVLTDQEYFQGADEYLKIAYNECQLPILRKDFMIDVYQIYQSYLLGADCILLIMACLDDKMVQELHKISLELGMDVLIEIHTQEELERALKLPFSEHNLYGINNRNLNTFNVDLQNSIQLQQQLRQQLWQKLNNSSIEPIQKDDKTNDIIDSSILIVAESGIHSAQDIKKLREHQIHHFLIGEQFMKTEQPEQALKNLLESV